MGNLQAKFEQLSITGISKSTLGPILKPFYDSMIMDVHAQELALEGDERLK